MPEGTALLVEMLHQASVAFVVTDLLGHVTYVNRGAEELYGFQGHDAVGRPVKEVVALPDDHGSVIEIVASVAAHGQWVGETWARRADGARLPVLLTVTPLRSTGEVVGMIGIAVDNSERHEAESTHARLAAAVEQTAEAVMIADPQGTIVYVNPAFERTTGYTAAEAIGQNTRLLNSGVQGANFYAHLWRTLLDGQTWHGEMVNRRKDGSTYIDEGSITPVYDRHGALVSYVAVRRDVTRLREIESTLSASVRERMRVVEALTRLEIKDTPEATAQSISETMLLIPGVDRGGIIHFNRQHASLLGAVGPAASPLRQGEVIPSSRAMYLRERATGGPWAEQWHSRPEYGEYGTQTTASGLAGMAYAPINDADGVVTGLVAIGTAGADWETRLEALLPVVREFALTARSLLGGTLVDRSRMDRSRASVARVIASRAFAPVFQAVVDLTTGEAIGYEALTRFTSGARPDLVFGEAHSVKMGVDLEVATLGAALDAARGLPSSAWLSINVSPRLLLARGRLQELIGTCSRPIVIEITEHELIDDYGALREALAGLGSQVRVAVDDAGAGVANFNHIVELRPDFVKIDIGLIRNVDTDPARQAAVLGLLHFARASDRWVIAEGVETEAEREMLVRLDVPYGQGYLFGQPMSMESTVARASEDR